MSLYRSCIFWANSGDNYSAVEEKVIQKFNWYIDVYYGNSVWLDQATNKKFDHLNKELVAFGNTLSMEIDSQGVLLDGTKAIDHLNEKLADLVHEIRTALRDEIEASRRPWYESLWKRVVAPSQYE